MNIMKTDLLLLNKKFMNEKSGNTTTIMAPVPAPAEESNAGMNALMFKGLQNLMTNPRLAEETGVPTEENTADKNSAKDYVAPFSTNIAFKSGKGKALTAAASLLGAAALTSCTIEFPESEPTKNVLFAYQYQDNSAVVAAITALQAQIAALQQQMAARDAAQAQRDSAMLAAMNSALQVLQNMSTELSGLREDENRNAFWLRMMLYSNNKAVISAIATLNGTTQAAADSIVSAIATAYENGEITFNTAMEQVQSLLGQILTKIDNNFAEFFRRDSLNNLLINQLVTEAGKTNTNLEKLFVYADSIIANQKGQKEAIIQVSADITTMNGNITTSKEDLIKALVALGWSRNMVETWNTNRMIATIKNSVNEQNDVIKANGDKIDSLAIQLQSIIDAYNNHQINEQEALSLLRSIDQGIKDLNGKVDKLIGLVQSFKSDLNAIKNIGMSISYNTGMTAYGVANLNNQFRGLRNDVNNLKSIAIEIRDDLKNGISIDDSKIIAAIQALNLDANAGKDEIIAKLNVMIPQLNAIDESINNLDQNNQSKLDYVANLIKNVTPDNQGVIQAIADLKNANETNIAAATDKLAGKLDTLIELMRNALDKLDGVASNINVYGERLSAKFDINNGYLNQVVNGIDLNNATLADLKAEVERIRPLLNQINDNIVIGDNYLDEISKKQLPELQKAVENINNIGGGLTQEQLREELERYGKNTWDTYGGYFIQAGSQRGEIIELLKALGKEQANTTKAINDGFDKAGNDAEKLRKIVQSIRDYLPELKHECHLECHCPTIAELEQLLDKYKNANEEIIGVLN